MNVGDQFVRFCAVGMTCYLSGLALLAGLTEVAGLHYLLSFAISFVATNLLGFWLNGRFSFGSPSHVGGSAALRYLAVSAASLTLNMIALALLVERVGLWYLAAVVTLTAINVPINFVAHRLITFRLGRIQASRVSWPLNR